MVSVARFRADAEDVISEIERRCSELEENAVRYFVVARDAQRIFRGYVTRKHIAKLNEAAVCIQKNWRAFVGRMIYELRLKERYDELCWSQYIAKAMLIQRHWRGYWVRSRIFSFYKLKSWLEYVREQNKYLKCQSEKYRIAQNQCEIAQREEESKEWIVYILFKLHHLLRTRQICGIYSLPGTRNLSDIEKMLTCLKYKDFMTFYNSYKEDLRQKKAKELPPYILQKCKYLARYERVWYEHRLKHEEPYIEDKVPKDRYTRYEIRERAVVDQKAEDEPDLGTCRCSYCTAERSIKR